MSIVIIPCESTVVHVNVYRVPNATPLPTVPTRISGFCTIVNTITPQDEIRQPTTLIIRLRCTGISSPGQVQAEPIFHIALNDNVVLTSPLKADDTSELSIEVPIAELMQDCPPYIDVYWELGESSLNPRGSVSLLVKATGWTKPSMPLVTFLISPPPERVAGRRNPEKLVIRKVKAGVEVLSTQES